MNAQEFIKAWKDGHRFYNSNLKGEIVRSGDHWEMHINAEIIVFFDDVRGSLDEVVLLMDGDRAVPFCTHNWRVGA